MTIDARNPGGAIKLTPIEPLPEPRNLRRLKKAIAARWGTVPLIEILKEAMLRTGALSGMAGVGVRSSIPDEALIERLLLIIYGYGTNSGLRTVAAGDHAHSEEDLRYTARRYFTLDAVKAAAVTVANATFFARFQHWAVSEPKDIGLQTESVLTSGDPWDLAAGIHFRVTGHAAGNGSLMRAATSAVYFASQGREASMDAARRIAALTHGDRAAWEGTAVFHELVRLALDGADPLDALPDVVGLVHPDHRDRYAVVLDAAWHPDQATEFNGAVWPCLDSAVWALRTTTDYEHAVRAAIDLGGDTDTVAAVTGGLAGVVYGYDAIPSRWTDLLHVLLPGSGGRVLRLHDLVELSDCLGSH